MESILEALQETQATVLITAPYFHFGTGLHAHFV